MYIVPWEINLNNSLSINQFWQEKDGILIADWESYYRYTLELKDLFWNKIKNFTINNTWVWW
jgi:hypothetical protein